MKTRGIHWCGVVILPLFLILGGLVAHGALDHVTVQLKWIHQAQFAGFYAAQAQGFYAEEGIEVEFIPGGVGIDIFAGVASGEVQFAVVGADSILDYRSQGMPIKAIATTYRVNPFVLVAFADSGIVSPYDFPGHVIAVTPGYSEAQFLTMLSNVGVDRASFTIVDYQYDDTPFLDGEIDVTVSFAAGSLLPLKEEIGGRELNIIWPDDYGVHFYSDTLITNDVLLTDNPDLAIRFLRATLRGHEFAIEYPEQAVDATMPYAVVQDRSVQLAMLMASIPLI
jgi:NitT/TauT family transport system substrate-binding protein